MMRWRSNRSFQPSAFSLQLNALIVLSCSLIFSNGGLGSAIENKTFDGTIDFLNKGISLSLDLQDQGEAKITGKLDGDAYGIHLILRHIRFGKSDLLTDFYTSGAVIQTEDKKFKAFKGKAWTQASLLNFKPLKEFTAEYELTHSKLTIHSLSWADFELNGQITAADNGRLGINSFSNADVDISLKIKEMDLKNLAGLLGVNPEAICLDGKVSGQVSIQGPYNAVKIEAKLTASSGRVSMVKFKAAKIDIEGIWPVLRFVNAQINDVGGVMYELKGKFNLKELSDFNSAEHEVTVYSSNNAMRLQDWVIKRESNYKGEDVVEAEYDLEKNQALKMRIKDQEEILGWEKTVKF